MTISAISTPGDDWFATLDELAVLSIHGQDAETFLQGQLSNDVRELAPGDGDAAPRAQLTSFNSPKGRVLATLLLIRDGMEYLLLLPHALADAVRGRLQMFVLRSRVTLEASSRPLTGLHGARAVEAIAPSLPATPWSATRLGADAATDAPAGVAVRCPDAGSTPRALVIGNTDLSRAGSTATMTDWWRSEITAGVPTVMPETQDRFVAQMLNLEQLGGISFSKGCYTGQEVIARAQHLGRVKRRLRRFRFAGDAQPARGDDLTVLSSGPSSVADAPAVGTVVLAAPTAAGQGADDAKHTGELLAVVQETHADQELQLATGTVRLQPLPLPAPPFPGAAN
jgi:folate-binding protein YgfZ